MIATTVMYHGSPNSGLTALKAGLTYVTAYREIAARYARDEIVGTAKVVRDRPTVYECEVRFEQALDLRRPLDRVEYVESARYWNEHHQDMDDKLPKLESAGFIMSRTGLPSFGHIATIFAAMPSVSTIIVDDGTSGITYALRNGAHQVTIRASTEA